MSHYYPASFITLSDLIKQYALSTSAATGVSATTQAVIDAMDTVQKIQVKQLLFDVSDEIMTDWYRTFVPFVHSYTIKARSSNWRSSWRYCDGNYRFNLMRTPHADLLSLSAVILNDSVLSASYYELSPSDTYPAWEVSFDADNVSKPSGTAFSTALVMSGTWGYHENPSIMWQSIGALQSALSDSATSFVATAGTVDSFEVYQYLQIDTELLFVTDVLSTAPYTITVERGVRGSTAASHLISAAIYKYRQMPSVIKAVRRRVVVLMQQIPELANLVQFGESTAEGENKPIDLPDTLKRTIWGAP